MEGIVFNIGVMIIVGAIFGYIAQLLRQPRIPAYILAGVFIGPVLHLVRDVAVIELMSEIGIAFLLFGVGLELNIKKLKAVGNITTAGSIIHILLLFGLGLFMGLAIGYKSIPAIYIGLILTFSSTMVVVKLLSDKNELDSVHGRIIVGMLLMQDIFAVVAISLLNTLGHFTIVPILLSLMQAAIVVLLAIVCSKLLFPALFKFAARSGELLFLLSIAMMFAFALIFAKMGFSIVIGAFVAGVALGNLPYNVEIIGKIRGLKDFFGILFFCSIGAHLVFLNFSDILLPFFVMLGFTIILLPVITFVISGLFGYKKKTAFMISLGLAQISEFSLIIAMYGRKMGHIGDEILALTIWLAIITMGLTAYFIKFDNPIYKRLRRPLSIFDKIGSKHHETEFNMDLHSSYDVVLVGYDRMGYHIFKTLAKMKARFIVVEINPDIIHRLKKLNIPCIYGDIGDPDIYHQLDFKNKKLVISTVPDYNDNKLLIKKIKKENDTVNVVVTALVVEEALELYEIGADYVIIPHHLGGEHAALILEDISFDIDKMIHKRIDHINDLKGKKERHPHHR